MKKFKLLLVVFLVFTLLPIMVSAQQRGQQNSEPKGIHKPGTGLENSDLKQQNQGTGQGLQIQEEQTDVMVENAEKSEDQKISKDKKRGPSDRALERRSKVANAVQEMLQVAERNQGVGQQIRQVAQIQNQIQEEADMSLDIAKGRKTFTKFLIGPNYGQLKDTEEKIEMHKGKVQELEMLKTQIENPEDASILDQQIAMMNQITEEMEKEINNEKKGFSLFGWLSKLIAK